MVLRLYGQASHAHCWNQWVAGQLLGNSRWQVGKEYAGGSERVEPGKTPVLIQCDEAGGYSAPNVLGDRFPKVAVERGDAAGKAVAILSFKSERTDAIGHRLARRNQFLLARKGAFQGGGRPGGRE